MTESILPLFASFHLQTVKKDNDSVKVKGLVSSLLRSFFCGRIVVFHNQELPYFKVGRKSLEEVFLPFADADGSDNARRQAMRHFLGGLSELVSAQSRQWVIVAHGGSLVLRNIDHLIPSDPTGDFAPPEVDFYWARAGKDEISSNNATFGLWAVRAKHLHTVIDCLKRVWSESVTKNCNEEVIWTRVVQELPLRKRAFEKGEVVAPRIGAVDWEAVSNAAFVTVPDWPEKEAWKLLQALYLGTYLGDETGMMLNILEA